MAAKAKPDARKVGRLADPDRLAALERTRLLQSPPEPAFDRITRLAARVTNATVSWLSFVGADRTYLKATTGVPDDLPPDRAFPFSETVAQVVVERDAAVVVNDGRADPLYAKHPMVVQRGLIAFCG